MREGCGGAVSSFSRFRLRAPGLFDRYTAEWGEPLSAITVTREGRALFNVLSFGLDRSLLRVVTHGLNRRPTKDGSSLGVELLLALDFRDAAAHHDLLVNVVIDIAVSLLEEHSPVRAGHTFGGVRGELPWSGQSAFHAYRARR